MKKAVLAITILLLSAGLSFAQVNLTAARTNTTLPDGSLMPMWGYSCGAIVTGSTATCAALNPNASGGWSPVLITLPPGDLTINLTNNLPVPSSLVVVGQLGGGLGTPGGFTASPDHSNAQSVTWPIVDPTTKGTPPTQNPRVRSFGTEANSGGGTASLTWSGLKPGTYLIESGTHPSIQGPMGLYGILVVTTAPTGGNPGTAYPAVSYNADVPLILSEIDPVQNIAVDTAVNTTGFSEDTVWTGGPAGCGAHFTCYPPTVNYKPLYYLINGVAFDKTNGSASLFPVSPATGVTGSVLVRIVNAGLRMHVPSIVGATTGATSVGGFSLIAEDGNPLPGVPRVQSEVFMAAGKTYDVMINAPAAGAPALPIFDRELSLSANSTGRDAGMLAYIGVNGGAEPASASLGAAVARDDTYPAYVSGQPITVSDPSKGVIANDTNVNGVTLLTQASNGVVALNRDGTFTYTPTGAATSDSFTYCANGTVIPPVSGPCSSGKTATVTLGAATVEAGSGILMGNQTYTATNAKFLAINTPGVLSSDTDAANYALTVATGTVTPVEAGLTVHAALNGGFTASVPAAGTYHFTYKAQNSQGTLSSSAATITLIFPAGSGLTVSVFDGTDKTTAITDYRWIIEEDRTFYIDPTKTTNSGGTAIVPTFGTNFHTSYMPLVAQGCVGTLSCELGQTVLGAPAVCNIGNGVCDTSAPQQAPTDPKDVVLDPNKRYYISILPGDGADALSPTSVGVGHGMGGAPLAAGQTNVTIYSQPTPFPPSKLSVFVFEDDFPLNGEQDAGGGVDILASNEPGLGGFNIIMFDDAGGSGDATGQMTYDMFNMPLSNSLSGTIDPATHQDACPISKDARNGIDTNTGLPGGSSPTGITATIVTCPKYEADGTTLSPLAGQAVVANLMPGRYGIVATEGADRIARGEEWLQTNTLDGQKAHDSFLRVGEPSFFQEFGPAGYHVSIGFANPGIINARGALVCGSGDPNSDLPPQTGCTNTVEGTVTTERMSRTPDERLYSSGSNDSFSFTQCFASLGDPDGEDFRFAKCDASGHFKLTGVPNGSWRVTIFDQWNDMLVDGLSTPVHVAGNTDLGPIAINQWQANIYTRTFFDPNGLGAPQSDNQPGLALVATNIRFRDGSYSNFNNTDLNGFAGFNEVFPLFSWYVVETDSTRYKNTGTHVVYDAGGPADGTTGGGTSNIGNFMANTQEAVPLPNALRVPGAVYCADADCSADTFSNHPTGGGPGGSTGRIDPPWVMSEGWQGFSGQNSFVEFGKKPFATGENGGIRGHVVYASTRPFDDPQLLLQLSWEPLVPHVTINLYQEGTAADGRQSLKLVDSTQTSSFDDWAQGFRSDGNPNMNCPGQTTDDPFFFTLANQPMWLDIYNNGGTPTHTIPNQSQFKCYDGMHNWNQVQPAPYDGMYQFPSITGRDPVTGAAVGGTNPNVAGTNCAICVANPTDGTPMLPAGKYVVEVVVPPGYELVKEEDKNILIGDTYIAPVTQQFAGLGNIFILPDQAEVSNGYNAQNSTQNLGRSEGLPSHEGDTGSIETFWPCVGQARVVPDFISLFPQSAEVAPFAGATRNLCDRKEITLEDQTSALAKFYIFTSTHAAAHYTGVITDDFTSEFDPFSPQFGEKFSPPNLPVSIKDWTGTEISRTYSDQWGSYNGLTYSTWEVNPPNPTGYAPQMMITCMNDAGTGPTPDPLYNPQYSQFCYEIPFMPGQTQYMDTPVVPTSGFAGAGYNNPDCSYPDATPAVSEVDGDGVGPWVSASGHTLTIKALGDVSVPNNAYSGPQATTAPYNQKKITRHYGFGGTQGSVTIGGISAPITGWSDTQISVMVPGTVPTCAVQQQAQFGGIAGAHCGELVITAANGKQSIDAVTVTVGGKAPTRVAGGGSIQSAIDGAAPGDLIIVSPGVYNELLIMWKPVRLQGVGAASSIINANTHPAGKMDSWRQRVGCLFGLAINGQPYTGNGPSGGSNPYDSTGASSCPAAGWTYFTGGPNNPQVDRIPMEGVLGWDTSVNGNLAQLLQEPSLIGAYEGAGITVLSKGVNIPAGSDVFGAGATESAFPAGTTLLLQADCNNSNKALYSSNFYCNPSGIDGMAVSNSSQGGGGIFVHGWGHNIQIANNRVYNNTGTLTGGITIGQGESPDAYLAGDGAPAAPGSCQNNSTVGVQLPYCFDMNVNVHNNAITSNSSIGDELFSSTPAGGGGVTFCTGADFYKFNYNWVCGNLSSGDGGGFAHLGFIYNGDIENNTFLFNQSTNPTVPTNGGGLLVMGAPPDGAPPNSPPGTECGGTAADADCTPGLSDGTGPNLVINANLIMGNAAESGSGGGLRLQAINGTEVAAFPNTPTRWNAVNVTNNIIANNVAGWDGAGISLLDALNVNIINNTVMSNDTTASSGVLFNTLGAPLASSTGTNCTQNGATTSCPQPAGLVSVPNSTQLTSGLPATITCPAGHFAGTASNGSCRKVSYPELYNDVFWQNRSFYIGVGSLGSGVLNQQNIVSLFNAFSHTPAASQPQADAITGNGGGSIVTGGTGACVTSGPGAASYWDIGVRGDSGPTNHASGVTLTPTYNLLTDTTGYSTASLHNTNANPTVLSQYCNGSRVPPELGSAGYQVPPGISDATVPNPVFNLTPAATVDEGNNWINISWGPLSLTNPVTGGTLGNYGPAAGSPVINYVLAAASTYAAAPATDFFGNPRKTNNAVDAGAIEFQAGNLPRLTTIVPNNGARGYTVPVTLAGANLTGASIVTVSGTGVTVNSVAVVDANTVTANFVISTTAALTGRTVNVTTPNGTSNNVTFTVVNPPAPTVASITPTSGRRGQVVPVTITGTSLLTATAVTISGTGVTASNVIPANDNTLTANLTISATATLSARTVTVTTLGGTSAVNPAVTVTVTGPTLSSITPAAGLRGSTVPVIITGVGLTGATAVNFAGTGVTATAVTPVNDTTVTANVNITLAAAVGARTVTVVTPIGTTPGSLAVTFTVQAPTLTSVTPNSGNRGTAVNVTLAGTGLAGATSVTVSGTNVAVSNFSAVDANTVTATFTIAPAATLGTRNVAVVTSNGTTNTVTFRVTGATATISAPSPALTTTTANTTTKSGTITVSNTATGANAGPLSLTADPTVTKTAGLGTFSIVPGGTCASSVVVNPGANCTINVQYVPSGITTSTAHVTVTGTGLATATQNGANFNGN